MTGAAQDSAIAPPQLGNGVVRILSTDEPDTSESFGSQWFSDLGLLISDEGHVVANALAASAAIVAVFADGRRHAGKLVAADAYGNLALFKLAGLQREPVPQMRTGDARNGERVHAVLATRDGIRRTITSTIHDAQRVVRPSASSHSPAGPYIEILQPDKPGPIQGPIFDDSGKVLGFVTLESRPENKTQMALAVPIADVLRIADELDAKGKVRRARLGIGFMTVSKELAEERGLAEPTGVLVGKADKGGPADRAGLGPGDIILRLGPDVIRHSDDYLVALGRLRAGTRIEVEVLGPGGRRSVRVMTGELVYDPNAPRERTPEDPKSLR